MKGKYYLRGIGVGILFATLVLFTTYCISGRGKMTDEEVIARAEELGMVMPESALDHLNKPYDTSDTSESDSDTKEDTTDTDTKESETQDTEEADTEAPSEGENGTTSDMQTTDEEASGSTQDPGTETRIVTFTIVSGMNSWNVASILQDQGVIDNASDFDAYLEANGYSARISTGEYSIAAGTDYETIAKMLTGE